MSRKLASRLALDATAFALLLAGLAYWWLGNAVHEAIGCVFFALLIGHNMLNRRWYGNVPRTGPGFRDRFNVLATALLLGAMSVLLVTSVLISETVFAFLGLDGGLAAKQVHILAAYWALLIVSVHLGLRWPMIMTATRNGLGWRHAGATGCWTLRLAAAAVALAGATASFDLVIGSRLLAQPTTAFWDFGESTLGFFTRCLAVAGLYVALTYYGVRLLRPGRRAPQARHG